MSACLRQRMCEESMCLNQSEGLCVCLYTRKRAVCAFATENEGYIYVNVFQSESVCVWIPCMKETKRERERMCAYIHICFVSKCVCVWDMCLRKTEVGLHAYFSFSGINSSKIFSLMLFAKSWMSSFCNHFPKCWMCVMVSYFKHVLVHDRIKQHLYSMLL